MGLPFHRFVLSSGRLLRYHLTERGQNLTVARALDLLFLDERDTDVARPDHMFKSLREQEFRGIATLRDLILRAFTRLSDHYFEFRQRRLFVKAERFGDWQRLITRLSPLPVIVFALQREFAVDGKFAVVDGRLTDFLTEHLSPSVLPTVYCPEMDELIASEGLSDLHVHLNGSTEADAVWLDTLNHPRQFYSKTCPAYADAAGQGAQSVREQYEQIEEGLSPDALYRRLRLARALRFALCEDLFGNNQEILNKLDYAIHNRIFQFDDHQFRVRGHPVRGFHGDKKTPDTVCEGIFWWKLFSRLRLKDGGQLAAPVHVYLLLMAQFTRFIVQQVDQKGFDQFQKITVNEFRTLSEEDYQRRFNQLARSDVGDLAFLEGRFAPKSSPIGNWKLISAVLRGYARHHGASKPKLGPNDTTACQETRRLRLGLTAHFIKEADWPRETPEGYQPRGPWRHYRLRNKLFANAVALLALHRRSRLVQRYLVGIDAAANELHASPEVFAPIYRMFRFHGFNHFTYHAGEDFRHLLSGMRAVIEAVSFLDLRRGDRIGHATALGVDPKLWQARSGSQFVVPLEEWLDNLVFAYRMLSEDGSGQNFLFKLRDDIGRYARKLYGSRRVTDPIALHDAWRLRCLDPRLVFNPNRGFPSAVSEFTKRELQDIAREQRESPDAYALFDAWHSPLVRSQGMEMVTVTEEDAPVPLLAAVQRAALNIIINRRIVLEAMLTSNVRISIYDDYSEHHIRRWLENNSNLLSPVVVMASDDPGIFGNCLRNDFIHLLEKLNHGDDLISMHAILMSKSLNYNARVFRFHALDDHVPGGGVGAVDKAPAEALP